MISFFGKGQDDLMITGVIDGNIPSGSIRSVELFVINDIPDLSVYSLGIANNGLAGGVAEVFFPANSASAGDIIHITRDLDATVFQTFFGFSSDFLSDALTQTGDDAFELFYDASGLFSGSHVVVDVFGEVGIDGTGQAWEYTGSWAYRNNVINPSTSFNANDWSYGGVNALDAETSNATAAIPVPIGSYIYSGPKVASFLPTSGPVGTTITINGSYFSDISAENTVYFGNALATVTNATATELTVTVPFGATHARIKVISNVLTGVSEGKFRVTFPGATTDANTFQPKVQFSTRGNFPRDIALGDFDLDGYLDIVSSEDVAENIYRL